MGAASSQIAASSQWQTNAANYHDNLFDARAKHAGFMPRMERQAQQQQQQQQQGGGGGDDGGGAGSAAAAAAAAPAAFYAGEPTLGEWLTEHRSFVDAAVAAAEADGDTMTVKLGHVLQLLRGGAGMTDLPSQPHVVRRLSLRGEAEPDSVRLSECEFEIELLKPGWVAVRLMPGIVAMLGAEVTFTPARTDDASEQAGGSVVGGKEVLVDAEMPGQAPAAHVVGVVETWYCLIASRPGVYTVKASVLVPFLTSRKTGFAAVIPQATSTELEFSVPDSGVLIKCSPALETITERVEPGPSASDDEGEGEGAAAAAVSAGLPSRGRSTVRCRLPPTSQFNVQWTEYLGTEQEKEDEGGLKQEVSSTVQQHCLASIGEGVLSCRNTFRYDISSGQISVFRILIDPGVTVLSVESALKTIPVKRWEVSTYGKKKDKDKGEDKKDDDSEDATTTSDSDSDSESSAAAAAAKGKKGSKKGKGSSSKKSKKSAAKGKGKGKKETASASASSGQKQLLTVWLDYGLEDTYSFVVLSEMSMGGTSAQVRVPVLTSLLPSEAPEVSREQGWIAIVARTNVEIEELACEGNSLTPTDVGELPAALTSAAGHAILYGYKFLHPSWNLLLDVKKHADANVLVAAADSAHFKATCNAKGDIVYSYLLRVRNTQKQYLRVSVPPEAGGRAPPSSRRRRGGGNGGKGGKGGDDVIVDLSDSDDDDNSGGKPPRGGGGRSAASTAAAAAASEEPSFEIWSTIVAGRAVKPALDSATGDILIPLSKSGGSNGSAFSVELMFIYQSNVKFDERSTVGLAFARVDLPINHLYVSCYLPDSCDYGEFEGDLSEVSYFDGSPPSADAARATAPQQHAWGRQRKASFSYGSGMKKKGGKASYGGMASSSHSHGAANRRGHAPVRVAAIDEGQRFMFEQLLVCDQTLALEVEFKPKKKPSKSELFFAAVARALPPRRILLRALGRLALLLLALAAALVTLYLLFWGISALWALATTAPPSAEATAGADSTAPSSHGATPPAANATTKAEL